MKCIKCNKGLVQSKSSFTGTCNNHKGQEIGFVYCDNPECDRYKLYCGHFVSER